MALRFHVSSARNRASITRFGLDWTRMGAAPGIAGSPVPEVAGVFLCRDEWESSFFVRLNNTGGAVDVWAVEEVEEADLVDHPDGFGYLPARIPPERVRLHVADAQAPPGAPNRDGGAYRSTLTITIDEPSPSSSRGDSRGGDRRDDRGS